MAHQVQDFAVFSPLLLIRVPPEWTLVLLFAAIVCGRRLARRRPTRLTSREAGPGRAKKSPTPSLSISLSLLLWLASFFATLQSRSDLLHKNKPRRTLQIRTPRKCARQIYCDWPPIKERAGERATEVH